MKGCNVQCNELRWFDTDSIARKREERNRGRTAGDQSIFVWFSIIQNKRGTRVQRNSCGSSMVPIAKSSRRECHIRLIQGRQNR